MATEKNISKDRVRKEQRTDKFCSTLAIGKTKGKSEYFHDEDGVIYRRRKQGNIQLVDPRNLVRDVIVLNHNPIVAAHPGRKRTLEIVLALLFGQV